MNKTELLEKYATPIKVGSSGFVILKDIMGEDSDISDAARISYGKGTRSVSDNRTLIRYLMRHQHSSPFEMCEIKFHIRLPIHVMRQLVRQRTASLNEYSTRYSEAIDAVEETATTAWRSQSTTNKQGSDEIISDWSEVKDIPNILTDEFGNEGSRASEHFSTPGEYLTDRQREAFDVSREIYNEAVSMGVAREQARAVLPLATYTEIYWKIDLRNLFNFLRLRLDSHAQLEIREFTEAMWTIVQDWVPIAAESFVDYQLEGAYFSKQEMLFLKQEMTKFGKFGLGTEDRLNKLDTLSKREQNEFRAKFS